MPSALHVLAQAKRNRRVPLLLLWLLLLITLGVAALTVFALRGQRAEIEQARDVARDHLSLLLAGRIDHALQTAIREPLLRLDHARGIDLTDARLAQLQAEYPYIATVLVLDQDMKPLRSRPLMMDEYRQRLIGWITERLQTETTRGDARRTPVRTFIEAVDGWPTVFAFLRVHAGGTGSDDLGWGSGGWVLVQSDFRDLRRQVVDPITRQFERDHQVVARFSDPASMTAAGDEAGARVSTLFPGWMVVVDGSSLTAGDHGAVTRKAIIAAAAGLLLAVLLICMVIAWDLRREYTLVEMRNRFVANVSHELRTPVSLIRMCAETLSLKRIADPERQQQYLDRILAESERLSTMIGDVLDFSRLRQGLPTYRLNETALDRTVDAIVRHYQPEWARRGARVELSIGDGLPPVSHDPGAIRQALVNLVDNAIEHGGASGDIRVSVTARDGGVRLSVTDHGRGITDAIRRDLLRSMRRGQIAAQAAGNGLGLALVQQISNIHRARFALGCPGDHDGVEATISFDAAVPG